MLEKRIMGLDYGSKTIGVAVSDLLGLTAQGIETININEQIKDFNWLNFFLKNFNKI